MPRSSFASAEAWMTLRKEKPRGDWQAPQLGTRLHSDDNDRDRWHPWNQSHRKDPETTVLGRIRLGTSASGKRTDATNSDARPPIFHSEMHATSNLQRFRDLVWRPTEARRPDFIASARIAWVPICRRGPGTMTHKRGSTKFFLVN